MSKYLMMHFQTHMRFDFIGGNMSSHLPVKGFKNYFDLFKVIIIIAIPAIIEMSLNTMLMVADTVMVGQMVGKEALSAVGIANSIMFTLIFVFTAFNTGAVALISRSYGEKNMEKAAAIAHVNLWLNFVIGMIVMVLAYVLKPLFFSPYQITETVREQVYIYYDFVMAGMIFQFMSFAFASISRGVENTKVPMYITAVANLVNIIMNYILIKGVWFFPEMGIGGAALATTLSRVVAFAIFAWIFFGGKHQLKLRLNQIKLDRKLLKPLWTISLPGAIEQFLMQMAFLIAGIIITTLATDSEALFRILINVESTSFMPAVGISIAAATLVGKALGEKNPEKAYAIGQLSGLMGILWGVAMGIVFLVLAKPILNAFTPDTTIILLGVPIMFYLAINQPLLNYNIAMSGALRGAGDTQVIMRLTALRLWLFFLPGTYLTIVLLKTGVAGLWYAEIISFVVFSSIMYKRFRGRKWAQLEF